MTEVLVYLKHPVQFCFAHAVLAIKQGLNDTAIARWS